MLHSQLLYFLRRYPLRLPHEYKVLHFLFYRYGDDDLLQHLHAQ
jgi:hypothetical protein